MRTRLEIERLISWMSADRNRFTPPGRRSGSGRFTRRDRAAEQTWAHVPICGDYRTCCSRCDRCSPYHESDGDRFGKRRFGMRPPHPSDSDEEVELNKPNADIFAMSAFPRDGCRRVETRSPPSLPSCAGFRRDRRDRQIAGRFTRREEPA